MESQTVAMNIRTNAEANDQQISELSKVMLRLV